MKGYNANSARRSVRRFHLSWCNMMRTKDLNERGCKRAFTLIEILCVILIISILAAMIIGMGRYARDKALRARALGQMGQINGVIVEYKVKNGRMPANLSILTPMLPATWTYSNNIPLDPYNKQYQFTVAGEAYRIFSMGPDMTTGSDTNTGDDIEFNR